jgi:hypothetical protein
MENYVLVRFILYLNSECYTLRRKQIVSHNTDEPTKGGRH